MAQNKLDCKGIERSNNVCEADSNGSTVASRKSFSQDQDLTLNGDSQADGLSAGVDQGRREFHDYWQSALRTFGVGNEAMLLKKDATQDGFVTADRDEVISWVSENVAKYFPSPASSIPRCQSILEVGAGIGRLTGMLSTMSNRIVAVDFIQEYIERNKESHRRDERPNDQFICADATKLQFPADSFDFILWNWLLMYLSDEEMKSFVTRCCRWLKVGGLLFGRESCGEPSSKKHARTWAPKGNPTEYRPSNIYTWLLTDFMEEQGVTVEVIFKERRVSVYQERIGTESQQCWLIRRIA